MNFVVNCVRNDGVLEAGRLNTEGDVEWMQKAAEQDVGFEQIDEMVDASGNEVKIKRKKKLNAKEKKKKMALIKKKIAEVKTWTVKKKTMRLNGICNSLII